MLKPGLESSVIQPYMFQKIFFQVTNNLVQFDICIAFDAKMIIYITPRLVCIISLSPLSKEILCSRNKYRIRFEFRKCPSYPLLFYGPQIQPVMIKWRGFSQIFIPNCLSILEFLIQSLSFNLFFTSRFVGDEDLDRVSVTSRKMITYTRVDCVGASKVILKWTILWYSPVLVLYH